MMKKISFQDQVTDILGNFAARNGFTISMYDDLDASRGAMVVLENDVFIVKATKERTLIGDEETICICCKIRPQPRAPLRVYAIAALSAFVHGYPDPYPLRSFFVDAEDILRHENQFLSVELFSYRGLFISGSDPII